MDEDLGFRPRVSADEDLGFKPRTNLDADLGFKPKITQDKSDIDTTGIFSTATKNFVSDKLEPFKYVGSKLKDTAIALPSTVKDYVSNVATPSKENLLEMVKGGGPLGYMTNKTMDFMSKAEEPLMPTIEEVEKALPYDPNKNKTLQDIKQFATYQLPRFFSPSNMALMIAGGGSKKNLSETTPKIKQDITIPKVEEQVAQIKPSISPISPKTDVTSDINLGRFPPAVSEEISKAVKLKPELGTHTVIGDEELYKMAEDLTGVPLSDAIRAHPEAQLAAERLKEATVQSKEIMGALSNPTEGLIGNINNIIDKWLPGGKRVTSEIARALRQEQLPVEMQQELAKGFEKALKDISKDPILNKNKALTQQVKYVRDRFVDPQYRPTAFDKAYYTWINGLVSSPKTHKVNLLSNVAFAAGMPIERAIAAGVDTMLGTKLGQVVLKKIGVTPAGGRSTFFSEIPAMGKGILENKPITIANQSGTKFVPVVENKIIQNTVGLPTKLLALEDKPFKWLTGKAERGALEEAVSKNPKLFTKGGIEKEIAHTQLERTLQLDPGTIGKTINTLRSVYKPLKIVQPFVNIIDNIMSRGVERTPLGAYKVLSRAMKGKTRMKEQSLLESMGKNPAYAEKGAPYSQREFAKDTANTLQGAAVFSLIAYLYSKGKVTGNAPSDKGERDAFYAQGHKPNSIEINGKSIPMDKEPYATQFATIVNAIDAYEKSKGENETLPKNIVMAITSIGKTLLSKSATSGTLRLVDALSSPERFADKFIIGTATSIEPQLFNWLAQKEDKYLREPKTLKEAFMAKTPFLSKDVRYKPNVFGEPIERTDVGDTVRVDPVVKELEKIGYTVNFPVKDKDYTEKEYWEYSVKAGKDMKKAFASIFNTDEYKKIPNTQEGRFLKKTILDQVSSGVRSIYRPRPKYLPWEKESYIKPKE